MSAAVHVVPDELAGVRILITAQRRAAELGAALERRGATVEHAPVLSVVPSVDDQELIARTLDLLEVPPQVVVITTGIGLRGWVEAADAAGIADRLLDVLSNARLVVRGPKARGAVQALGLLPDWVAESETSAEIRDFLLAEGVAGQRIAIQHHGAGSDGLDEEFEVAGADVVPLVVYRWGPAPDRSAVADGVRRVARRAVDAVVFTAAPGTTAFLEAARDEGVLDEVLAALRDPDGVLAAAVGTTTAAPLVAMGVEPLVPDRFRVGALVRVVVRELAGRRGFRVDTLFGELRVLRAAAVLDGRVLALSPSSLAVLRRLAEARGAVVSRAELLKVLPGASTDAHTSEVAVARLRESLGDARLVATVVKRGYRLEVSHG